LKRDTTVFAHGASFAGALALVAIGLTAGPGSALASDSQLRDIVHSVNGHLTYRNVQLVGSNALRGHVQPNERPIRPSIQVASRTTTVLGHQSWLSPPTTLPTRSVTIRPTLLPLEAVGKAGTPMPAPQALHEHETYTRISAGRMREPVTVRPYSQPYARAGSIDPFARVAPPTTKGKPYTGPNVSAVGLVTAVSAAPLRMASLSSLSHERVLDHQAIARSSLAFVAPAAIAVPGLGLTRQRRPDPSGLRLSGVHPTATRYLRWGESASPLGATSSPSLSQASQRTPAQGAKSGNAAALTAGQMPGGNASTFFITGYTATGSRTASGTWPHWGTVAVDTRVIPLGSTVYIQGLGSFRAEDTGGAVIGSHIDVFVDSAAEAYQITGYRLVSYMPPGR
jgi:3D (Asp-Asp-Asp) domain-containing protein